MIFIDLIEVTASQKTRPITLNVANIQSFQRSDKTADSIIRMMNNQYYFIKESVAEIKKLIGRG